MSALDAGPNLTCFGLVFAAVLAAGVFVTATRRLAAAGLLRHAVTDEADRLPDRERCS